MPLRMSLTSQNSFLSHGSVHPKMGKRTVTKSQPKLAFYCVLQHSQPYSDALQAMLQRTPAGAETLLLCVMTAIYKALRAVRRIILKQIPGVWEGREWGYRETRLGTSWSLLKLSNGHKRFHYIIISIFVYV